MGVLSLRNKYWVLTAGVIWLLAAILLAGDISPLREDTSHFLAGEGAYDLPFPEGTSYSQEFKIQSRDLSQIGIVVDWQQDEALSSESEGLRLEVLDASGNVLAQEWLAVTQMEQGSYTDVDVNLTLKHGRRYELRLVSELDAEMQPVLLVCSSDYPLWENRSLRGESPLPGVQLLTRYHYENALDLWLYLKAMGLFTLLALGIAVGLPADKRVRTVLAILLLVAGPPTLGRRLELLLPTNVLLPHAMKWNVGLMYLFEMIVLLFTQSGRFTIVFCNLFLTILYCANYFVHAFRGTYLKANELTAIRTAADVAGNYQFRPDSNMAMCLCLLGVFLSWGMCTGIPKRSRERLTLSRAGKWVLRHGLSFVPGVMILFGAGHFLLDTDLLLEHGFSYYSGINQEYTYYFDGYLVGSMLNIKYNRIEEPAGYSVKQVEQILGENRVAEGTSAELPHIILIMNESFSDLRVNGNLELSQENLSFWKGLQENAIKGYVNASVLGGGTANSEFEVFTGCTMGFLPDSYYAYEQAVTGPMDSMISNLKSAGYTTYSMHPEKATNWRRNVVYQYLGFEHRLWKEDFQGAEVIHSGVSDRATFDKVVELYENREAGEKLFIFDLTMQNHGYYRKSDVERSVEAVNVDSEEADIYLSLIYETDKAFAELVHYFEKQDERVIICMFGDHQPKFDDGDFYEDIYRQTEGLSKEEQKRNLYKTPFVIWANYDIEEAEDLDIGMNYLGVLLQQTAGVELTPYFRFLKNQMTEYPVITVNGYCDKEGNYSNWSGEGTEFADYRMLQYNYLFDPDIVKWGFGKQD